jgi:hypothetical protein
MQDGPHTGKGKIPCSLIDPSGSSATIDAVRGKSQREVDRIVATTAVEIRDRVRPVPVSRDGDRSHPNRAAPRSTRPCGPSNGIGHRDRTTPDLR